VICYNSAARDSQKNPYEEKAYRGAAHREVQAWWEQCQEWMLYYKCQCAPLVQDIKGFLHAFRGKEEDARLEVDTYMEDCARGGKQEMGSLVLHGLPSKTQPILGQGGPHIL